MVRLEGSKLVFVAPRENYMKKWRVFRFKPNEKLGAILLKELVLTEENMKSPLTCLTRLFDNDIAHKHRDTLLNGVVGLMLTEMKEMLVGTSDYFVTAWGSSFVVVRIR